MGTLEENKFGQKFAKSNVSVYQKANVSELNRQKARQSGVVRTAAKGEPTYYRKGSTAAQLQMTVALQEGRFKVAKLADYQSETSSPDFCVNSPNLKILVINLKFGKEKKTLYKAPQPAYKLDVSLGLAM